MSVVVPAIKAKMGSTTFYVTTISARELVQTAFPAYYYDWWQDLSLDERMQREVDQARILKELAPYFANDPDRFFGSIIITVHDGAVEFEGLGEIGVKVPRAYAQMAENMGFVIINKGDLVVLDGQHRWMGLNKVISREVEGPEAKNVATDQVTVIFIDSEATTERTRKIFNKVNRYAKSTSRSDNLITSEDDAVAIITRRLMTTDGAPFNVVDSKKNNLLVNWKSNTLSARSTQFTTMSALYDVAKIMLHGTEWRDFASKYTQLRPAEERIDGAFQYVQDLWTTIFESFEPFKLIHNDPTRVIELRDSKNKYALLFKPAGQIAFMESLFNALETSGLDIEAILKRANRVNWALNDPMWQNIIVNPNGTINANREARDRTVKLMKYLLVGDRMKAEEVQDVKNAYNIAKGGFNEETGEYTLELPELEVVA